MKQTMNGQASWISLFSHSRMFSQTISQMIVVGVLALAGLSPSKVMANSPLPKPVAPWRANPQQNTAPAPTQAQAQGQAQAPQPFIFGHPTQGVALFQPGPNSDPNDQPGPKVPNSLLLRRFDEALFRAAQNAGRPIIVVISKADCPGCTLQIPSLQRVLKEEEFKSVEVFQVDFINQKELAQRFNAQGWTVILGFKGAEYRVRMQGLNRPSDLRRELRKLLL